MGASLYHSTGVQDNNLVGMGDGRQPMAIRNCVSSISINPRRKVITYAMISSVRSWPNLPLMSLD
jgi:hypothetical protein